MILLLLFAFLGGIATIFAPCIWPILPIVLSSSATGGHQKPLGVTLGIVTSFALLTLSISYLVMVFHLDPQILRLIAVVVISFLGLILIFPALTRLLEGLVSRLSSRLSQSTNANQTIRQGFWGGYITGFSLGAVWSPCAGPILATIAALSATRSVTLEAVFLTIAFSIGVSVPLFILSSFGSVLFTRTRFLSAYTGRLQQVFGVVMIVTAFAILQGYDRDLQAKLLDAFPSYTSFLVSFEDNQLVRQELDKLKNQSQEPKQQAPNFVGITHWLNSPPLTIEQLRGKVVLVDFWTYSCINCIRTLPYVKSWYEKYKDAGLVVVGVHTPEFEFEKSTKNVADAVKRFNITYPVAQDNDYATWQAYDNHYWPAKYLVDKNGVIRYEHFGEGKYEETEMMIKKLLQETGQNVGSEVVALPDQTPRGSQTPETYLGSQRMEFLYPQGRVDNGKQIFRLSENLFPNRFSFGGEWIIADEYAASTENAVIELNFIADHVFLVMKPENALKKQTVKVLLDGKTVDETNAGEDVVGGIVTVNEGRLYRLIDLHGKSGNHILRLEFQTQGTQAYAFTFG